MMKLISRLMLSCRKATALMDKKSNASLTPFERIQLFMHTSMCDACTLYQKQSHFIDNLLKDQGSTSGKPLHAQKTLPNEAKSKIIKELEKI